MPGRRWLCLATGGWILAVTVAGTEALQGPDLGRPAAPEEIAALDMSIPPDGAGLPPGAGTARQGEPIYKRRCAACHGEKGEGGTNDRLVGGLGTLASDQPIKTVGSYWQWATTLFDYTRRAMPYNAPLSLTADETYAVTAYLLYLNEIIGATDVMNAQTLPLVKMPNRNGFIDVYAQQPR